MSEAIEVVEPELIMINPRNMMVFTLSSLRSSGLLTFEVGFIAVMVFIIYLSSFTNEILLQVHWSIVLVLALVLCGIMALSYVQQSPKNLRTRFILKSSDA